MPTLSKAAIIFAGLLLSILSVVAADENALRSLVEAENNFARTSAERGIRESFLQFFAENSIIFAPEPKNGKKFYTDYQDKGLKLLWRPIFATISGSSELGVTTGPWELQKSKIDPTPIAFGDFLSVWKKHGDNSWKVMVDVGVDHPQPGELPIDTQLLPASEGRAKVDVDLAGRDLEKAQKKLAAMLNNGTGSAILDAASNDIRVLRDNSVPAVGRDAASALLSSDNGKMTRQNSGGGLSGSGDLAYRYGSYTSKRGTETERGYYLTIWQRQNDAWKIIVDLQKKAPEK